MCDSDLRAAVASVLAQAQPPLPESIVETLIKVEKQAKKASIRYSLEDLSGSWRLCFVTGTQKAQHRAGIVLGAGRYIPQWLQIYLTYTQDPEQADRGLVENTVQLGALQLTVTGPIRIVPARSIVAFDFTHLILKLGRFQLYEGEIRGGAEQAQAFTCASIRDQAFFAYFQVDDTLAAARGRGGGLAIWGRC